ncbi:MAG: NYN domain-containing protein [Lachnospiraceae bacterium]|nr:NYN domain-containing protein [Lachnospiraceae bacterium]
MIRAERTNIGILAHVDAGKTTLAESILFNCGSIRKAGRVDHGDAFLDTYELEKERGITIFSKMAQLSLGERQVTLLDTPGHADFSAEMERVLQVLDCAVLVISGADGIQGHDMMLWQLLRRYHIPVFLFVNKMDQPGTDREQLLSAIRDKLDKRCIYMERSASGAAFSAEEPVRSLSEAALEEIALCDEQLLDQYLESGEMSGWQVQDLIMRRKMFPCYFGSALKNEGVVTMLDGLAEFLPLKEYPEDFGARVFKIARDSAGNRLTYLKVTGGSLKIRQTVRGGYPLSLREEMDDAQWEEKADRLLIISGASARNVQEVSAGSVCGVMGLEHTYAGQGLGWEDEGDEPFLEPVLTYAMILPDGCDLHHTYRKLQTLEEEVPELHLAWDEETREIRARVMGEVQLEVLQHLIMERLQLQIRFGPGRITYKETIAAPVEGVGHFEPLRHYAEVHLLMEPGEAGSGLVFSSSVSTDDLSLNWQRLILTHLEEKEHRGVLTGSPITDMKITVAAGKAHPKHTEGGDFRQATYRAVRQGLMHAQSVLLEPYFSFRLEIPSQFTGRAMTDIGQMYGTVQGPEQEGEMSILTGTAPVSCMQNYQADVNAYTRGAGRLFCSVAGYRPCHNAEEVIAEKGYSPEADIRNTPDSVFCSHGAGMVIPWDQVGEYMHLPSVLTPDDKERKYGRQEADLSALPVRSAGSYGGRSIPADIQDDDELMEIFERTFGSIRQQRTGWKKSTRTFGSSGGGSSSKKTEPREQYLLVDGYNIIFAWDDLKDLAKVSMDAARGKLLDILANYQGYRKMTLIVVFDAYKVQGGVGETFKYHNIYVVYTRESETADSYIEKTVHAIAKESDVTVATSDAAEQMIIWGSGARRLSARELREEIRETCREIQELYLKVHPGGKVYLFDHLSEDLASFLEDVRLGRRNFEDQ